MSTSTLKLLIVYMILSCAAPLWAEETAEEAPEPRWTGKAGLAFLATSGNTDNQTLGLDFTADRRPDLWGLSLKASFNQAEEDGVTTAERYLVGARVKRAIEDKPWELFLGLSAEQDEFAGIDRRTVAELGGLWRAIEKDKHKLSVDLGLTWTDEDRIDPEVDTDAVGALLGFTYAWKLSETATFNERLLFYPNFDESDDWRLEYTVGVTAALTDRLGLEVGFDLRYRNEPIGDADDTDTTTKVALVANF